MKKSKGSIRQEFPVSHVGILKAISQKRLDEREGGCAGIADVIGAGFYRGRHEVIQALKSGDNKFIAKEVKRAEYQHQEMSKEGLSQEQTTFHKLEVDSELAFLEDKDLDDKEVISKFSQKRLSFLNYPMGRQRHITTVAQDLQGNCHYVNPNPGGIFDKTGGSVVGQCKRVWRAALEDVSKTKSQGPVHITFSHS